MPVKVSVIVPVHHRGPAVGRCLASLLRQSLPPDAYEVVLVDDGSTDAVPARLDAQAAGDPRIRVVHQENSGRAGEPRNAGIEASRGEYVLFVDAAGDRLGDEALERMYAYGVANDADVVVGRTAGEGEGRAVPAEELFRGNRPRASVGTAPLMDSLTPPTMIRRAFLDRTGLRFPEGRRCLGDQVFVTEACLRAGNVSVLSDYVCSHHVRRGDASNPAVRPFDPAGYAEELREALDVVERYTAPGPLRDGLFRRWLCVEMVDRLRGRRFLDLPEGYRKELFEEIHQVVVERFRPGVAAPLRHTRRVVAALAADGRYDDVVTFAEWEAGVGLAVDPEAVAWHDGVLRIGFTAELTHDGGPMTFPSAGGSPQWPPRDMAEAVRWLGADTVDRFDRAVPDLLLRERTGSARYFQPVRVVRETVPAAGDGSTVRLVLRATATVDPATAVSGGPPGEGLWDVWVRVGLGGWTRELRLGPAPRHGRPTPPAGVVAGRVVLPYWTGRHAGLALDVGHASTRLGLGKVAAGDVTLAGDRLRVILPLYVPEPADVLLRLTGARNGGSRDLFGTLAPGGRLEVALPGAGPVGRTWLTAVCLTPREDGARCHPLPFALHVASDGVLVVPSPQPGGVGHLARRVRRALYRALGRITARRK